MSTVEKVEAMRNRAGELEVEARVARRSAAALREAADELERLAGLDAVSLEARVSELAARADVAADESRVARERAGGKGAGRGGGRGVPAGRGVQ